MKPGEPGRMTLEVLLPTQVLVEEPVTKVVAEGLHGSFCLLPRHVDFVAALAPGILSFWPEGGGESLLAVDEGTLVKCGGEVRVSTRNAVRSDDLDHLREVVEQTFRRLDERERLTRTAIARLEAGVLRRFLELQERFRA